MAQRSDLAVQTFVFADLSGFTALTEAHGDEQAADLVGGFCAAVRRLLAAHQAQEVRASGMR
jgi:adenylate cyclase